MLDHPAFVIVIAVAVWWLSTGLVLAVVNRSQGGRTAALRLMVPMSAVGAAGIALLVLGAGRPTPLGSYAGFFGALLVWAWHEAAFLTGLLAGPARGECPPGLTGLARFRAAWRAVSDHEIAILITGVGLFVLLAGSPNTFGLAAFGLLWGMRISAKLLIFLGAAHAVSDMMPSRIAYLKSYFNTTRTTPLFPLFLAVAGVLFAVLVVGASQAGEAHSVVGHTLLATFMALAIVEHLVLVLPVSDTALWRWAMARSSDAASGAAPRPQVGPRRHEKPN